MQKELKEDGADEKAVGRTLQILRQEHAACSRVFLVETGEKKEEQAD